MIDRVGVAPVGPVTAAPPVEPVGDLRQQDFQRALAGMVGKAVPAQILARLGDGSYMVRVAGTPARMMLPSLPAALSQPGAQVDLTLVALSPRPTFQLNNANQPATVAAWVEYADGAAEPATGTPARGAAEPAPGTLARGAAEPSLYTPAGGAVRAAPLQAGAALSSALTSQAAPAPGEEASAPVLSATARAIGSVLATAARAGPPQTAVTAPQPLLAAPPASTAVLTTQLQHAISTSGLFYESHVAEWDAGGRTLADLQREPQMQRRPGAADADPATAQFINLQLSSQEQARVSWQGQLMPGQDMRWQISRDAVDADQRGDTAPDEAPPKPAWRSALKLRFAALGELGATVVLVGEQIHIHLNAGSADVERALRAHAERLELALAASGNPLASLSVADDSSHE